MKQILPLFVLSALAFLTFCAASAQQPAAKDGAIALFNGKDLTGWGYTASDRFDGKTEASDGRYSAKDGILTVHPHDAKKGPRLRQMWTTQEFPKDFHLKLEFRAAVNRLADADAVLGLIGTFYDRLIAHGVRRTVPPRDEILAEAA